MTHEEQIENVLKHINADIKTLKGRKEKEPALSELEFDAVCLVKAIMMYRADLWNSGHIGIIRSGENDR